MANNKSARKRILTAERNRQRNRAALSALRTSIKKFRAAVAAGQAADAAAFLKQAHSTIDRSAKRGIIPSRTANRYKSRLSLAHVKLASAGPA